MRPLCYPETSVPNHQSTLRNGPEERRYELLSSQEGLCSVDLFTYSYVYLFIYLFLFYSIYAAQQDTQTVFNE